MVYTFTITTPKNIVKTDKQKTLLKCQRGIIKSFHIFFPPGCYNLTGIQFAYNQDIIIPRQPQGFFVGNNININEQEHYILDESPYILNIYTYNLDEKYPHTINGYVNILESWMLNPNSERMIQLYEKDDILL